MKKTAGKRYKRYLRHRRVRATIHGTAKRPRLAVFRSHQHIYAQVIDDEKARTILSSSDLVLPQAGFKGKKKTEIAALVGKSLAEQIKKSGIKAVVFDRGGFKYHGRVKALADGLRKAGVEL